MRIDDIIRSAIVRLFNVKPELVSLDAMLREDLGADSIGMVELIMALEEQFGLSISQPEMNQMRTVHDVMHYVAVRSVGSQRATSAVAMR